LSKGSGSTVNTTVDPQTQAYVTAMRQRALAAQGPASAAYQPFVQGGNLGFSALTGNAGAANQFMNPYTATLDPFFASQRAQAVSAANDQATQAGAFGGDRSAIGAATAGNLADQNAAQFRYQAFNDAMQRAGLASQLGFNATGAQAQLPGLLANSVGPYGTSEQQVTHPDYWSQLLGLGLTAGGFLLGGPAGAAAGASAGKMIGGKGY
jgi:hypothetical protein